MDFVFKIKVGIDVIHIRSCACSIESESVGCRTQTRPHTWVRCGDVFCHHHM